MTSDFSFLEYICKNSLIGFNSILKHENDKNLLYSIFSYCEGTENEVVLRDVYGCEEDNIEGYIEVQKMMLHQFGCLIRFIGNKWMFFQKTSARNKHCKLRE